MNIIRQTNDEATNLALDVINKDKQGLVFVNSKRSAEAQAEKISKQVKNIELVELSEEIKNALASPTKQCERLATIVLKGVAFHHAGLHYKQRQLIEDNFRNGTLKIICATPTLAQGLDLPAFRVIIRDLKRFGRRGMAGILVLEYEQMAGRAGRPGKETFGEAICIAKSEKEMNAIYEEYINGIPENIYSKLGVEPVLRTYVLSLVASGFVSSKKELLDFFDHSFYASQFGDMKQLHNLVEKVISMLQEWKFLKGNSEKIEEKNNFGFISASILNKQNESDDMLLKATILGEKVAELYLDPFSANQLIEQMKLAKDKEISIFSLLFMISSTLEMRPLPSIRMSEFDEVVESTLKYLDELLLEIPDEYDENYDEFVRALKQSLIFNDWIEEIGEDKILEKYNVRPGEVNAKKDTADWLLYSSVELAKLSKNQNLLKYLNKLRTRLEYGAREELLILLKLKNIGKVRARKLYNAGFKNLGDLKKAKIEYIANVVGDGIAKNIKEQLGEKNYSEDSYLE